MTDYKKAVVYNFSGVLSDNKHREHLIKPVPRAGIKHALDFIPGCENIPNWEAFYEELSYDAPNHKMCRLFKKTVEAIKDGSSQFDKIIIMSGHPKKYRHLITDWLALMVDWNMKDNQDDIYSLMQRPDDNFIKSEKLRMLWLQKLAVSGVKVTFAFEDRIEDLQFWEKMEIPCIDIDMVDDDGNYPSFSELENRIDALQKQNDALDLDLKNANAELIEYKKTNDALGLELQAAIQDKNELAQKLGVMAGPGDRIAPDPSGEKSDISGADAMNVHTGNDPNK